MKPSRKEITDNLTRSLFYYTRQTGVFGCSEVTIGIGGSERVDYMTYDTKGIFRCYEIKSSKEDFYSDAKWSFVGHYNYFVLTKDVYEEVKQDIPKHVGVVQNGLYSVKRATKQTDVNVEVLKDSLIRSLSREFQKSFMSKNIQLMQEYETINRRLNRQSLHLREYEKTAKTLVSMIRRDFPIDNMKKYIKEVRL